MADASKRSDSRTPGFEKAYRDPRVVAEAKRAASERARRKACHGSYASCEVADHPIPDSIKAPLSFLWGRN